MFSKLTGQSIIDEATLKVLSGGHHRVIGMSSLTLRRYGVQHESLPYCQPCKSLFTLDMSDSLLLTAYVSMIFPVSDARNRYEGFDSHYNILCNNDDLHN